MAERPTSDKPRISADLLIALGDLTLTFGGLEYSVAAAVWLLLHTEKLSTAQTVTAQLSSAGTRDILEALVIEKLEGDPLLDSIQEFRRAARAAEEDRNHIVHSYWHVEAATGSLVTVKQSARGERGFREQEEVVTADDIRAITRRMNSAVSAFQPTSRTTAAISSRGWHAGVCVSKASLVAT